MAETKRRGFHGLEDRIHELEAEDRKAQAPDEERERKLEEAEVATAEMRRPPVMHDE